MADIELKGYVIGLAPPARRLDVFGDSTQVGALTSNTDSTRPPSYWINLPGFTVVNRGLRGDSTGYILAYHNDRAGWSGFMKDSPAHVVVFNHGINDRNALVSIAEYTANIRWMVKIASTVYRKRVVLETPNPIDYPVTGALPLADYVEAMRDVADEFDLPLVDQFAYLTGLIGPQPITNFMPDGVHPNDYTYRLKGEFANRELFKILMQA